MSETHRECLTHIWTVSLNEKNLEASYVVEVLDTICLTNAMYTAQSKCSATLWRKIKSLCVYACWLA